MLNLVMPQHKNSLYPQHPYLIQLRELSVLSPDACCVCRIAGRTNPALTDIIVKGARL